MKSKFSNRVYNFLERKYNTFFSNITTLVTYVKSKFQGVDLGRKCRFYGNVKFVVGNGGNITIGWNCTFRSTETSNYIGLNHRCILSATPGISPSCKLIIGDNCGFSGTSILCFEKIIIGNNVRCGANTLIIDGDAHFDDCRTSPPKPIIIEDFVFIGANVVVKKGVTIGKNSVIGMNSVVTHDIPPNSIAVGVPCKVIKTINK